jgi:hypothetical protein
MIRAKVSDSKEFYRSNAERITNMYGILVSIVPGWPGWPGWPG